MSEVSSTNNIGTKITQALSAGSGVDIIELATTLAEAETQPRINSVTNKKSSAELNISGYGTLKSALSDLKTSLGALQNKDELLSKSVSSQAPDSVSVSLNSELNAIAGTSNLVIASLAKNQVVMIDNNASDLTNEKYTSLSQNLSDTDFSITITSPSGGAASVINISTHTPQGIIDAINSADINGIKARVLNLDSSGNTFNIVLEGKTGASNSFDVTSSLASFGEVTTQASSDLDMTVNGIQVYRDSNSVTDVVPGVKLDIKNTGTTNVVVSSNTGGLRESIDDFIFNYNSLIDVASYLTGKKNEEDELAGSLANEKNSVNSILSSMRGLLDLNSTTPSSGFNTFRDLGISAELGGKLSLRETTYANAIENNLDDVRTMLTANTNDQLATDSNPKGLALDAQNIIDGYLADSGTIRVKTDSAKESMSKYEKDLVDLQERLEKIKSRYLAQFAAMETIVQRSKNTGEYLSGQIKSMQSMYDN
ncbi:flagellar filament capping protein FliD [Gammaproteobacteria bacterium]|jgi:flagellar hook-associated protein 2|nr:flagellar filament capping protein FliD [Gammaproteobacteria bacterium]MDC1528058.1 flagellar filament capping protein FliD [Gammaproteobacteria bacterium]